MVECMSGFRYRLRVVLLNWGVQLQASFPLLVWCCKHVLVRKTVTTCAFWWEEVLFCASVLESLCYTLGFSARKSIQGLMDIVKILIWQCGCCLACPIMLVALYDLSEH